MTNDKVVKLHTTAVEEILEELKATQDQIKDIVAVIFYKNEDDMIIAHSGCTFAQLSTAASVIQYELFNNEDEF